MSLFERITLWVAAIVGALAGVGSLYVALAVPLKWWPFAADTAAGVAPVSPVPGWALVCSALLGLALLATVLSFRFRSTPRQIATSLRLQFNAGNIAPTLISEQNIWHWYALTHVLVAIDPTGLQAPKEHKILTIFLTFDRPVKARQILIEGGGAALPPHEVKDCGPRHAIITFREAIPGVVLDIKALL